MRVIGIDPGKHGFICELDSNLRTARVMKIPFRPDEIICYRTVKRFFDFSVADLLILEKVSCQPIWSASSGMNFGKTVGQLQMLLSPWPFLEISARKWQKDIHIGFSDNMNAKEKSLAAFHRINPTYGVEKKIDNNLIDAFLIAEYGLRINAINSKGGWAFDHCKP